MILSAEMPGLYVGHGDTASGRNKESPSQIGVWEAVPRLNSDRSFVVSDEKDVYRCSEAGRISYPALFYLCPYKAGGFYGKL